MFKKIIFLHLMLALSAFSNKVQKEASEYDLKAAYICNITKFIYWNSNVTGDEFIIGVLEPAAIYRSLTEITKTKTVNEKKIVIRKYAKLEEIDHCHILFIPENSSISLKKILAKAQSKNILTISEQQGYGSLGSAINFVTINDKLKFEVNLKTLESIGLKASAQFLKLAVVIG